MRPREGPENRTVIEAQKADEALPYPNLRPYEVVAADLAGMLAKSWQITDERKEALGWVMQRLEYDQSLPGHGNYKIRRAMELLRAMLDEHQ